MDELKETKQKTCSKCGSNNIKSITTINSEGALVTSNICEDCQWIDVDIVEAQTFTEVGSNPKHPAQFLN